MRTSIRTLTLPAAALIAALALTACQSTGQDAAASAPAKPAPTSAAPTASTAPTAGQPATAPQKTTAPPTESAPKPTSTSTSKPKPVAEAPEGADGNPSLRPCTAADVKVVASKVSRPINHLALTITNTGDRTCHALNAPLVGFEHSQAPIAIVEDSKPQAVVSLAPGASAYASLILTGEPGEDTHGTTVRTIKVSLTADSMVTLKAPEGTYVDDGAAVSYWQQDLEDALQY
ncbi:DUF4232 domain-containing protein [Streptomyces roseolus]|uniref:DUF4232 domain-containing protein n=1 Tax=Streptomyces roseolus TaxID=67358 RepID=UPI0016764FA0|nr:DUF4232 domain-containing protein [Streptomyces roseolus]GGR54563.1 hypothetical protein GCM10010282_54500 [Streptomyces roseolus]